MSKNLFSKFIVLLVVSMNVCFTLAVLYIFKKTNGSEPTALITAWFSFTTVELWSLANIKKHKIKNQGGICNDKAGSNHEINEP